MSEGYLDAGIKQLATYVKETALTNEPLSAGEVISEITPYPIGIMPVNISNENPSGLRPRVPGRSSKAVLQDLTGYSQRL
jgi:hypothetical protein